MTILRFFVARLYKLFNFLLLKLLIELGWINHIIEGRPTFITMRSLNMTATFIQDLCCNEYIFINLPFSELNFDIKVELI